jgi:hypothetical protein
MTYRYPYIVVGLLAFFLMQGCQEAPRTPPKVYFAQRQNPYFPLAVGNRWAYSREDAFSSKNDRALLVEATRYQFLTDRWYVVLRYVWYTYGNVVQERIRYWTYGDSGHVLVLDSLDVSLSDKDLVPDVFCDFEGDVGMTWRPKKTAVISVHVNAREDSVSVDGRTYRNCVSLLVEENGLDNFAMEVYAKNIGLVRKGPYSLLYYEIHDPTDGKVIVGR